MRHDGCSSQPPLGFHTLLLRFAGILLHRGLIVTDTHLVLKIFSSFLSWTPLKLWKHDSAWNLYLELYLSLYLYLQIKLNVTCKHALGVFTFITTAVLKSPPPDPVSPVCLDYSVNILAAWWIHLRRQWRKELLAELMRKKFQNWWVSFLREGGIVKRESCFFNFHRISFRNHAMALLRIVYFFYFHSANQTEFLKRAHVEA